MATIFTNIEGKVARTRLADVDAGAELPASHRLVWTHIDGRDDEDREWVATQSSLPETVRSALLARETRPRAQIIGKGVLVNLRGLGTTPEDDPDPLTSIRFWAEPGQVISVSYRTNASLETVCGQFEAGAITSPGDVLSEFARDMAQRLDSIVAEMGDTVDFCESRLDAKRAHAVRRRVSRARSQAIAYRRFVVPQVQALQVLVNSALPWIEDDDALHLREAIDAFSRMAEELEAVRERSALISEELTDLRAEQMDRRALLLSIMALVFLPLTFLTGLLGMNVAGIPYHDEPWAFWGVVGISAAIGLVLIGWFAKAHWLRDR